MSYQQKQTLHSDSVLYVPELMENILLKLEHKDIVIASGVCSFWKNCIAGSRRLQKKIYKLPILSGNDENPHFDDLSEDSRNATIPRHELQGQNLWKLVRECEDKYMDIIHEMSDPEQFKVFIEAETQVYWLRMMKIRQGFQGVRWRGNGWPRELQLLHCDLCGDWHTDFRFDHLHPLFHFLGDMSMCFRGYNDRFLFCLRLETASMADFGCWEDSCRDTLHTAQHLAKAYSAVVAGGVSNDLFVSPLATKLIEDNLSCLEDPVGLTLFTVVPYMIRVFRRQLHEWRTNCHNFEIRGARRHETAQRHSVPVYPTDEDWERHVADYPKITSMWEKTLADVDTIMSEVPFWEPVLAAEIEIDDTDVVILFA